MCVPTCLTSRTSGGTTTPIRSDDNGNETDDGTFTYQWDFRNRLVAVTRKSNGQVIASGQGSGYTSWSFCRRAGRHRHTGILCDAQAKLFQLAASLQVAHDVYDVSELNWTRLRRHCYQQQQANHRRNRSEKTSFHLVR